MDVTLTNNGTHSIRVIVDGDTINDQTVAPGEEVILSSKEDGIIELRELGA